MTQPTLYLASQSPRRREMIQWLGIPVQTMAVEIDEAPLPGERPVYLAVRLARSKTAAASAALGGGWVLAADTVVDLDGVSLAKPLDEEEARSMLLLLRDREHLVHTAVALSSPAGGITARRVTTRVLMRPYSDVEIDAYIATGDPMDKAGAYAIQHAGFHPVSRIESCYTNVVGLPLGAVVRLLRDAGWDLDPDIRSLCSRHFGYRCEHPDEGEPT
jgi:septum formation protein